MLTATKRERQALRNVIFASGATLSINENTDGTWFADVYGVIVEGTTAADCLRRVAEVLEES